MIIETIIIIVYSIALLLIFLYALAQLNLLFNYVSKTKQESKNLLFNLNNENEVPFVTIQLPVYNELYVMERLLNNIAQINYPKNKL